MKKDYNKNRYCYLNGFTQCNSKRVSRIERNIIFICYTQIILGNDGKKNSSSLTFSLVSQNGLSIQTLIRYLKSFLTWICPNSAILIYYGR